MHNVETTMKLKLKSTTLNQCNIVIHFQLELDLESPIHVICT